jgi:hypothetical protein
MTLLEPKATVLRTPSRSQFEEAAMLGQAIAAVAAELRQLNALSWPPSADNPAPHRDQLTATLKALNAALAQLTQTTGGG